MQIPILFNPLDISGPIFLLVYFITLVVTGFFLFFLKKYFNGLASREASETELNNYEIACLRGGLKEVLKLAAFRITTLDQFKIQKDKDEKKIKIERVAHHKNNKELHEAEKILVRYLRHDGHSELQEVLRDPNARKEMNEYCSSVYKTLADKKFIWTNGLKKTYRLIKTILILFLVGLAVAKICYAIYNGHYNIIFLCLLSLFGVLIIGLGNRVPKYSLAGSNYLKNLQTKYASNPDRINSMDPSLQFLMVAVFGTIILQGTSMGFMHDFSNSHLATVGSSGCGSSSCSSSSDGGGDSGGDGGSCGGGCGGCGGGGD